MFDVFSRWIAAWEESKNFEINEFVYPVAFRMTLYKATLMLVHPSDQVIRDADIKCATGTAREYVQIELFHGTISQRRINAQSLALSIDRPHDMPSLRRFCLGCQAVPIKSGWPGQARP
jgi:hypothetical protein